MNDRAHCLHDTADQQLTELLRLGACLDPKTARQPCPGREKLGDGTIGALAKHTADNYQRIAEFITTNDGTSRTRHTPRDHPGHRPPRILRLLGHKPPAGGHGPATHQGVYAADMQDPGTLAEQLSQTRDTLRHLGDLTDHQLDTIPPKDSFRFCDGTRTLEQVLDALFKHQRHQLDTLTQALS